MANDEEKKDSNKDSKNALEWTVFGIGCSLVLGILLYLTYETVTHKSSPAEITVQFNPDPSKESPYRYHLIIKNKGGDTAEEVTVELTLQKNDSTIDKAELQLAFVPTSSQREGWVNFSKDPAKADTVTARVVSFKKP